MSIQDFGPSSSAQLSGGALRKLRILYETRVAGSYDGQLEALFNPNQLRYQRNAEWRVTNVSAQLTPAERHVFEFQSTSPMTLALDLFFDTSECNPQGVSALGLGRMERLASALQRYQKPQGPTASSVLAHTEGIVQLTQVNRELHRPPVCELRWGRFLLLRGILTELGQEFSYFLPDGTPLRANLSCTFKEIRAESEQRARELHSADVYKQRVVRQGDSLSLIAHEEYGDPSLWRFIARANGISHPRRLTPGTVLTLPPLSK